MKKVSVLFLVAAMLLSLAACSGDTSSSGGSSGDAATGETSGDNTVRIGVTMPLTGSQSAIGNRQLAGIQLAIDMQNENGGIASLGGAQVELVVADTQSDSNIAVTEAERLITSEGICALMGTYSSAAAAASAPIAERYGIPYMITNATADEILQNGYEYTFRANVCNGLDAIDMVAYIQELNDAFDADIHNIAIVYENSDWGYGMSVGISNEIAENYADQFSVVMNEGYEPDIADFSAIVNQIRSSDVDLIIPMNYLNDALLFVQTLADYQVNIPVLAHSGGYTVPEFLQNAGSNANYLLTFSSWDPSVLQFKSEEATAINEKYKAEYSDGVDMDTYAANGWLGGVVMLNAIERAASTDPEAIKDAILATDLGPDSYECTLHPFEGIKFGETCGMTNQNIYAKSIILQVIDGQFELIGPSSMVSLEDSEIVFPVPAWSER